jgi:hypothetical protein
VEKLLANFWKKWIFLSVISFFEVAPSIALSGEAENVQLCIVASQDYANISLPSHGYEYDGGLFGSEVFWRSKPKAECSLLSGVNFLSVNGVVVIDDRFAGRAAKSAFESEVYQFEKLQEKIAANIDNYEVALSAYKTGLQQPHPDLVALEDELIRKIGNFRLRIMGSDVDLAEGLSTDSVAKELQYQIDSLKSTISRLREELRVAQDAAPRQKMEEVSVLRKELSNSMTEVSELKEALNIERRKSNDYEKKLTSAEEHIASLTEELASYKMPMDPLILDIEILISEENFGEAKMLIEELSLHPLYDVSVLDKFLDAALRIAIPIPASEYQRNLNAYLFLSYLNPHSDQFKSKIERYRSKLEAKEEQAEVDSIISLIQSSDDLDVHGAKMVAETRSLISGKMCSPDQIRYFGGWVKSQTRVGQYFLDCGDQRFWLNPSSEETLHKDMPVPRDAAEKECRNYIKGNFVGTVNFHYFDRSYTIHNQLSSVTVIQGFDITNSFGTDINYRAFCTFQPTGAYEVRLERK